MGLNRRKEVEGESSSIYKLFEGVLLSLAQEVKSKAGKVNMFFDALLALALIAYILSTGLSETAKAIASIWNPELTKYVNDTKMIVLFIILVFFCILCLILMYNKEREEQRMKSSKKGS